mmetsp:Transcript_25631/g.71624  ORF Transcript_25631/g.71624 Transcript_25631/m.71624 type:complete len:211 (+) Transcript_25631:557-1189(+)
MSHAVARNHGGHRDLPARSCGKQDLRIPLGSVCRLVHRDFQDPAVRRRWRAIGRGGPASPTRVGVRARFESPAATSVHAVRHGESMASSAAGYSQRGPGRAFLNAGRLAADGRRVAGDMREVRQHLRMLPSHDAEHPQCPCRIQRRAGKADCRLHRGFWRAEGRAREGAEVVGGSRQARRGQRCHLRSRERRGNGTEHGGVRQVGHSRRR